MGELNKIKMNINAHYFLSIIDKENGKRTLTYNYLIREAFYFYNNKLKKIFKIDAERYLKQAEKLNKKMLIDSDEIEELKIGECE